MLRGEKKNQPEIALNSIKSSENIAKAENILMPLPVQLIALQLLAMSITEIADILEVLHHEELCLKAFQIFSGIWVCSEQSSLPMSPE